MIPVCLPPLLLTLLLPPGVTSPLPVAPAAEGNAPADVRVDDFVFTTPSDCGSAGSMPVGGGDVGLNVWVEAASGDVMAYVQQSGAFDENNTLLKAGRLRVHLTDTTYHFAEQRLRPASGDMTVTFRRARAGGSEARVTLWCDVHKPVVHIEGTTDIEVGYETWRTYDRPLTRDECQQSSWKWIVPAGTVTRRDSVEWDYGNQKGSMVSLGQTSGAVRTAQNGVGQTPGSDRQSQVGATQSHFVPGPQPGWPGRVTFFHRNEGVTVRDYAVEQQGLAAWRDSLADPLGGRISGGQLVRRSGREWLVVLAAQQTSLEAWRDTLAARLGAVSTPRDRRLARRWWHDYWSRSYVAGDRPELRNYAIFRYMLGCNRRGQWPTKFNGGLFTFVADSSDAVLPPMASAQGAPPHPSRLTPDYRRWGGGTHTAQNQRLVYWGMLKTGDADLMEPQLDYYRRLLPVAELRSRVYWGHEGACYTEQMENFGLPNPAEYGSKRPAGFDAGLEYNAWLEYEWDTALEFCLMTLERRRYDPRADIASYEPMILSCLRFFDEHYQMLARQRGRKALDGAGRLVLYPGSGCETYKMAYNPASTVAGLRAVCSAMMRHLRAKAEPTSSAGHAGGIGSKQRSDASSRGQAESDALPSASPQRQGERGGWSADGSREQSEPVGLSPVDSAALVWLEGLWQRLPEIPLCQQGGRTLIAPAVVWERINNVETPQLYPVWPYRQVDSLGTDGRVPMDVARATYLTDTVALKHRSHIGWKQDNIWAACLRLPDDAFRLTMAKLADGPYRFPAFWGPGFDWMPDHNWGGSAVIGLEEMLLQEEPDGTLVLFPAWPVDVDVRFRLHASGGRVVEAALRDGQIVEYRVQSAKSQ